MLVNPNIAILIFIIVIVAAILIARNMKSYENFDKSNMHSFIAILGGLSIFVTFMFYYNIVSIQQQQEKAINNQELSRVNDNIGQILGDAYIESIPLFVYSINPLLKSKVNLNNLEPENSYIQIFNKHSLSQAIFSSWDDFRSSKRLSTYDEIGVISTFLQKADSDELLEEWNIQKYNFDNKTQSLGDMFFIYSKSIKIKTPENYAAKSSEFIQKNEYINLLDI